MSDARVIPGNANTIRERANTFNQFKFVFIFYLPWLSAKWKVKIILPGFEVYCVPTPHFLLLSAGKRTGHDFAFF